MNRAIAFTMIATMYTGGAASVAGTQTGDSAATIVYRALLLNQRCSGRGFRSGHDELVIGLETASLDSMSLYPGGTSASWLVAQMPDSFDPAIVEQFLAANARPMALDRRAMRDLGATLITHRDLDRLFHQNRNDPWRGFDNRYPKATGYIELSVPAFSQDGSHAIAYCSKTSGLLAGEGYMAFLELLGNDWVIVRMRQVWIS